MYETIRTRLETIRNLPICELNQRQTMLVALIANIVYYWYPCLALVHPAESHICSA